MPDDFSDYGLGSLDVGYGNPYGWQPRRQPLLPPAGGPNPPQRNPVLDLPPLPPEDQQTLLGQLAGTGLGALHFLGTTFDKPGRIVRGAIGGQPRELLNAVPFSDWLGLTDYRDRVSGEKLLEHAGLLQKNYHGPFDWGRFGAGLATELATDPITYLGGPLTKLGKVAEEGGHLAGATMKLGTTAAGDVMSAIPQATRATGFDLLHSEAAQLANRWTNAGMNPAESMNRLQQLAREAYGRPLAVMPDALEVAARAGNLPLTSRLGSQLPQLGHAPTLGTAAALAALTPGQGTALEGLLSVGKPWFVPQKYWPNPITIGEGQTLGGLASRAAAAGDVVGKAVEQVPLVGSALTFPFRAGSKAVATTAQGLSTLGKSLFGAKYQDSLDPFYQGVLEERAPAQQAAEFGARSPWLGFKTTQDQLVQQAMAQGMSEQDALRFVTRGAERASLAQAGLGHLLPMQATPATHLTPQQLLTQQVLQTGPLEQGAENLGAGMANYFAQDLPRSQALGLPKVESSGWMGYVPRQKNIGLNRFEGEGLWDYVTRQAGRLFKTGERTDMNRSDLFKNLPQSTVDDLFRDPRLAGQLRTMDSPTATKFVSDVLTEQLAKLDQAVATSLPGTAERVAAQAARDKLVLGMGGQVTAGSVQPTITAQQIEDLAARTNEALLAHPQEAVARGMGFYAPDAARVGENAAVAAARARAQATTSYEAMARLMRPESTLRSDLAARLGIVPGNVSEHFMTPVEELVQKLYPGVSNAGMEGLGFLGEMTGLGYNRLKNLTTLDRYMVPRDMADLLLQNHARWSAPAAPSALGQLADLANQTFKAGVYSIWPASYTRNLATGLFKQGLDDAFSPRALWDAAKYVLTGKGTPEVETQVANLSNANLAFRPTGNAVADVVAPYGLGTRLSEGSPLTQQRSVWDTLEGWFRGRPGMSWNPLSLDVQTNPLVQRGSQVGQGIEDTLRLSHQLAKTRSGVSPMAALEAVRQSHFDYGDLSSTEKVLRRLIPFYTFGRKNLPNMLDFAVHQPGKVGAVARTLDELRGDQGNFVPDYVSSGAAIPLPGAPAGSQRFLSSFGSPLEDNMLDAAANFASGRVQGGLQQLFGMLSPFVRYPIEKATGTQLLSGRPLADLKPGAIPTLFGALPENSPVAKELAQIVANSPGSRVATSFDKFTDERKSWEATLANLLTGVRVTDVDMAKAQNLAAAKVVNELLRTAGAKSYSTMYLPRDEWGDLTPRDVNLWRLYKGIQQDARLAALQKKAAEGDLAAQAKLARLPASGR